MTGKKKFHRFLLIIASALVAAVVIVPSALAQSEAGGGAELELYPILATLIYSLLGIGLYVVGYYVFDKILKLDLRRELVEDQNDSLGMMMAGVFIGIAIIIAAAMIS